MFSMGGGLPGSN